MPTVLTNLHVLSCPHAGSVKKTTASKLVIQTQPVLTNVGPVTMCPLVPPPSSNVKCTVVTITAGQATKLKVGGTPVLLSTLVASATAPPANPGGPLVYVPPGAPTPTKLNAV